MTTKLTPKQIEAVVNWMNDWEQLKGTSIPLRFKEDFSEKHKSCPSEKMYLSVYPKRDGELCIICGENIDCDNGSICSDCDNSHLDD